MPNARSLHGATLRLLQRILYHGAACAVLAAVLAAASGVGSASAQTRSTGAGPVIAWVTIPAGAFEMGCVEKDERCGGDELPRHTVTLTRAFDLMATEVTIGMYRARVKNVDVQPAWSTAPNHPVVIVTWEEADAFCRGLGGRLPTEAEWERAARGGRAGTIYPWGDEPPSDKATAANGATFESDAPRTVGSYAPNGYGLYDMAGNVWEWVADWASLYRDEAVTDPEGAASGRTRLVRGGSFGDDPENLRLSNRTPNAPDRVNVNVGFRCARDRN